MTNPLGRRRFFALILASLLAGETSAVTLARASTTLQLVMFREPACPWCETWDAEVGVVYDKTDEGRRAPLRRIDMTARRPADLATIRGVTFSPTFVLLSHGQEVGRIVGYPGEHFFWPLLQDLLQRAQTAAESCRPIEGEEKPC